MDALVQVGMDAACALEENDECTFWCDDAECWLPGIYRARSDTVGPTGRAHKIRRHINDGLDGRKLLVANGKVLAGREVLLAQAELATLREKNEAAPLISAPLISPPRTGESRTGESIPVGVILAEVVGLDSNSNLVPSPSRKRRVSGLANQALTPQLERDIEVAQRADMFMSRYVEPGWGDTKQKEAVRAIKEVLRGASPQIAKQIISRAHNAVCEGPSLELLGSVFNAAQEHAALLHASLHCAAERQRLQTQFVMATAPTEGQIREYCDFMQGLERRRVVQMVRHRRETDVADSSDYFRIVHKNSEGGTPVLIADNASKFWLDRAVVRNMGSGNLFIQV